MIVRDSLQVCHYSQMHGLIEAERKDSYFCGKDLIVPIAFDTQTSLSSIWKITL